jgi:hypothetical protein
MDIVSGADLTAAITGDLLGGLLGNPGGMAVPIIDKIADANMQRVGFNLYVKYKWKSCEPCCYKPIVMWFTLTVWGGGIPGHDWQKHVSDWHPCTQGSPSGRGVYGGIDGTYPTVQDVAACVDEGRP